MLNIGDRVKSASNPELRGTVQAIFSNSGPYWAVNEYGVLWDGHLKNSYYYKGDLIKVEDRRGKCDCGGDAVRATSHPPYCSSHQTEEIEHHFEIEGID